MYSPHKNAFGLEILASSSTIFPVRSPFSLWVITAIEARQLALTYTLGTYPP